MTECSRKVELKQLTGCFYQQRDQPGVFQAVEADLVPEPQLSLLNHDSHMTVTVEKFHDSPVDVKVLQEKSGADTYAREICLLRQTDGAVVQYGIVRICFRHLTGEVETAIRQKASPLGRILIDHDVLRKVKLLSLYRVEPAAPMLEAIGTDQSGELYGRTAIIFCDNEPAIELLEVVVV